jgi:hypothetical protein
VVTAVDINTSLQNYGFELVNKLIVAQWASLTAMQLKIRNTRVMRVMLFLTHDALLEFI